MSKKKECKMKRRRPKKCRKLPKTAGKRRVKSHRNFFSNQAKRLWRYPLGETEKKTRKPVKGLVFSVFYSKKQKFPNFSDFHVTYCVGD